MLETNCSLLQDIHSELQNPENDNLLIVSGSYDYYHYKIDGTNDVGWGCGYRTLQSICSWLKRVTRKSSLNEDIPSIREIQEILVEIGDKGPRFIDSKSWIGTFEAFLVLDHLFDVPCKVIHLERGELFGEKLTFLIEHFQKFKSPVMMGGDVDNASKCIMGISYDKNDDEKEHGFNNTHLLVVDPHFYGKTATKRQLQCDGWVCWKKLSDFSEDSFYNFCLPQLSAEGD